MLRIATLLLLFHLFAIKLHASFLPELALRSEHPRLLLLKGAEKDIHKAVAHNSNLKKVHEAIIAESDKFLNTPVLKREMTGRRLLGISRECLRRVFYLAYAYRMTGKPSYADRAEEEMLAVSGFSDWNPSHFLDVAEMTMGVAIGYDWLFDYLPQSSKAVIKEAIIEKGIKPSFEGKGTWWINGTNNWNQVCHAGISFGAIAIDEGQPQQTGKILERAIAGLPHVMKGYNPDGAYPEGYNYWGYGTMFNVLFIDAYEKFKNKNFDFSDVAGFMKTPYYMLHMEGSSHNSFNYSDAGNGVDIQPAMFWFAKKMKDPSLIWNEMNFIETHDLAQLAVERTLPALLIWAKDFNTEKERAPSGLTWAGGGPNPVFLMRSSWTNPGAVYMGLKCGSPSVSHGHMDVGSFVLDMNGERWAEDLGMQNYNSLETKGVDLWNMNQNSQRWTVFRYNNFAHNTLTINGQLQHAKGKAVLKAYASDKQFMNAQTDLSDLYKEQLVGASRGIAIVNGSYALVRDEVSAGAKAAELRWTLVTRADVSIIAPDRILLKKGGKQVVVQIKSDQKIVIKSWPAISKNDYDAANPGVTLIGFETEIAAGKSAAFDVFFYSDKNKPAIDFNVAPLKTWPKD
ncbi:heparinase II/III domain-containing protein [Niabella insulamsoli]|uniref:heparinase II/III domain-containing protein n=1 Tax=Niabella insulamsoli TaxID=3144874 RepID=UPI0031FBD48F